MYKQRDRHHRAVTVTDLDYADDLTSLTERIDQAHGVLGRLEQELRKIGLYCNVMKKKTASVQSRNACLNENKRL